MYRGYVGFTMIGGRWIRLKYKSYIHIDRYSIENTVDTVQIQYRL